jgi:hypothetical protein
LLCGSLLAVVGRLLFARCCCAVALTLEEKKEEAGVVAVDKTNPLYAPDNFEPWRNAGYTNLAPKVRAAALHGHACNMRITPTSMPMRIRREGVYVCRRVVLCVCGSSLRRKSTDELQPHDALASPTQKCPALFWNHKHVLGFQHV